MTRYPIRITKWEIKAQVVSVPGFAGTTREWHTVINPHGGIQSFMPTRAGAERALAEAKAVWRCLCSQCASPPSASAELVRLQKALARLNLPQFHLVKAGAAGRVFAERLVQLKHDLADAIQERERVEAAARLVSTR